MKTTTILTALALLAVFHGCKVEQPSAPPKTATIDTLQDLQRLDTVCELPPIVWTEMEDK